MDPPSLVSRGPLPDFWQFPQSGEFRSGRRQRVLVPSTAASEEESSTSSANVLTACEVKRLKVMKPRDENGNTKAEAEASPSINNRPTDENAKSLEVTKQDYIHVRARRGQATDSHSLAERARREKIGERMKILQDLVPGCSKIIGKASVLDEIINYIQSLQNQVEFLSMKLEAVNSRLNSDFERFHSRDTDDTASGLAYGSQAAREYEQGSEPDWLHMHVGDAFERVTVAT